MVTRLVYEKHLKLPYLSLGHKTRSLPKKSALKFEKYHHTPFIPVKNEIIGKKYAQKAKT